MILIFTDYQSQYRNQYCKTENVMVHKDRNKSQTEFWEEILLCNKNKWLVIIEL